MSQPAAPAGSDIETSTIRTISWRLIPFLVLAYFFSYLDRVNLGFAALTMNADLDGMMGLRGWQWLFILEGIPSVLLGIVTWFYLTDRPEKADWLTAEQKAWLKAKLDSEIAAKQAVKHFTLGEALSSPKVIMLS